MQMGLMTATILAAMAAESFGGVLPRIAPRSASPTAYFVNTETGQKFTPIGANYVPLDWIGEIAYHVAFNSGFYDARAVEKALSEMEKDGYNIVRVFLDQGESVHQAKKQYGAGGPFETNTPELYPPFVDNLVDFLRRARHHQIYVIPTCEVWPYNKFYDRLAKSNSPENVEHVNGMYLSPGCIEAKKIYMTQLVDAVKKADPQGSLLSTVFSWELTNEVHLCGDLKPFCLMVGKIKTADGQTYDMADPNQRQQCMDNNIANWANQLVAAVRAVDPNAMVSASVFTYQIVGKEGPKGLLPPGGRDPRFPARPLTFITSTNLSYVDIHTYPTSLVENYSLLPDLESSEFSKFDRTAKPLLMGEFGIFKDNYGDINEAVKVMAAHRKESLELGFSGALYWTWDTLSQKTLWHLLEQDGLINNTLKPAQ
jgi:hypothetical protein